MEREVENAIEIKDLCVDLGAFKINDLNLNVKKGAITGLIGANGAGKSTLIKTIMRIQQAKGGSVLYEGKRFAGNEKQILNSVACVFDDLIISPFAKPKKLIKIYKGLYPRFDEKKCVDLLKKFNLPIDERVKKYSFGMKKKLSFVFGLCQGADTLILDEPTSGVDPYDRNELTTLIQEFMMDENHAVLFSTHITEDLDKIADYIVMMDNGKILFSEDKESLTEKFLLVRAAELTPQMRAGAKGVVKDMFGYTFVTADKSICGEGVQTKTPSVEELFVHILGESKAPSVFNGESDSKDVFGI